MAMGKKRRTVDSMMSSRFSTESKTAKKGDRSVISGAGAMQQTLAGLKGILAFP
jgi:hypothetical protein